MNIPDLTFYKMPLAKVATATIAGVMDALYASMSSAVDYRGVALPASHQWTVAQEAPSVAVYATPPVGTTMQMAPGLIWAGNGAAPAPSPIMLGPDTYAQNYIFVGLGKERGAYAGWNQANPWTTGAWSGFWRSSPITNLLNTNAYLRGYISQETLFAVGYLNNATMLSTAGALIKPYTEAVDTSEKDGRLYGMMTTGASGMTATFTSGNATASGFMAHSTNTGDQHSMVFRPRQSTVYVMGRDTSLYLNAVDQQQDMAGTWVKRPLPFCRSATTLVANGAALGELRGIYLVGIGRNNLTIQNTDGTDDLHLVGPVNDTTGHCIGLQAAA